MFIVMKSTSRWTVVRVDRHEPRFRTASVEVVYDAAGRLVAGQLTNLGGRTTTSFISRRVVR